MIPIGALISMLASMLGTATPGGRAAIYLSTESVTGGVRFQVIGAPSKAFRGIFLLEVNGDGNLSRHQGSAELQGGDRAVLSTVTVGVPEQGEWRARLRVEPAGAEPYEQVATSDQGA